jgi:hypothetical protein
MTFYEEKNILQEGLPLQPEWPFCDDPKMNSDDKTTITLFSADFNLPDTGKLQWQIPCS